MAKMRHEGLTDRATVCGQLKMSLTVPHFLPPFQGSKEKTFLGQIPGNFRRKFLSGNFRKFPTPISRFQGKNLFGSNSRKFPAENFFPEISGNFQPPFQISGNFSPIASSDSSSSISARRTGASRPSVRGVGVLGGLSTVAQTTHGTYLSTRGAGYPSYRRCRYRVLDST